MNINHEYAVMVFRRNTDFGTFYKIGLTKKDKDGNYINGYKDIRFKKGVELPDRTKIYIKKAWLDFYVKDNRTFDYIFCSEFETLNNVINNTAATLEAEGILVDPSDLPF